MRFKKSFIKNRMHVKTGNWKRLAKCWLCKKHVLDGQKYSVYVLKNKKRLCHDECFIYREHKLKIQFGRKDWI